MARPPTKATRKLRQRQIRVHHVAAKVGLTPGAISMQFQGATPLTSRVYAAILSLCGDDIEFTNAVKKYADEAHRDRFPHLYLSEGDE